MAQIISRRESHEEAVYYLHFNWKNDSNSGFMFPCDEHGNVSKENQTDSYHKCFKGELDVELVGVQKYVHRWTNPSVLRCDCGEEIDLFNFTNTCHECGADYNMSGQRLAPRSQWGEETGEHWTECY